MAAEASSIRTMCADLIQQMIKSDSPYQATITKLQSLQRGRDRSAKNPIFQTELNRICDIYQRTISYLVNNLQNRHQIVQRCARTLTKQLIKDHIDIDIIISSLENLSGALLLLQIQNGEVDAIISLFTNRIHILTTEQNPPHIDFRLWEQIGSHYK